MSDRPPQDSEAKPAPGPESQDPLTLADSRADSSEGSTEPVADASRTSSRTGGSDTPSMTTGGFDTLLGKVVVRAGLATRTEVQRCADELEQSAIEGRTLGDLLVQHDFVTRHQLNRLRQDFEAKKNEQSIPGYKIKRKLGSGAMATVFQAVQLSLDRLVAIKILPKKFSGNEKFIERFYKEGRAAAKLNHPNIVGAYDVGRAGEHHYFVMEYVDGPTIHERIAKGRVPEKEAIDIVLQVAKALQHAHGRGFVHRDIKPKNVMITKKGVVKLADLGLARAVSDREAAKAEAGRAYGTPYYISPEQIRGELEIGPPADLYGLGATFYHMVTGRVPFEGKNPSEVMHRHLKSPLEPPDHLAPDLSAGCAQVIEMMMAKKTSERYRNAADLIEDLELIRAGQSPHFAHRTLDASTITDTLTDVIESPAVIPNHTPDRRDFTSSGILLLVIAIMLVVSVIVNLIQFAVAVSD